MFNQLRLISELQLCFRRLRRASGFATTAVLTLALGVGANVLVFGVLNALLLQKLPVPHPEQLSFVQRPSVNEGALAITLPFPQYKDLRDRNRTFAEMGAYDLAPVGLTLNGQTQQQWATLATGSYFDLLGLRPFLGRFPSAADDARGMNASPYVVLTYDLWRTRFGADPGVIGRQILLSKKPFTIIGVAPQGFFGTERFFRPALWVDLWNGPQLFGAGQLENRNSNWIEIIGRRKAGVSVAQAVADLNRVAQQLAREYPKTDGRSAFTLTEPGYMGSLFGQPLRAFLGGVMLLAALVLAAACVNLSGLYAARAADRRKEIAIRMALGSTRRRILGELLTESVLLGLAGGALGCGLARITLHALTNYRLPFGFPIAVVVEPTAVVYGFALLLSVLAGVLCGLVPAREAQRTDLQGVIKSAALRVGQSGRRWTLRDALLLLEIATCCVLVTASAVSLRGLLASGKVPLGFHPEGVTVAQYNLNVAGYGDEAAERFDRQIAEQAARLPGVESAAVASSTPLQVGGDSDWIYRAGTTDLRPGNRLFSAKVYSVTPGYFHTAGTTLLAGRAFSWTDDATAPRVAVVNAQFAHRLFGDRPAVGESFVKDGTTVQIVGVTEQGRYESLNESAAPAVFYPLMQGTDLFSYLLVRTHAGVAAGDPNLVNQLSGLIHNADPTVPVSEVRSWQASLAPVLFPARAAAVALGVLGGLALVLALTGIFGLASYTVARRMREFGIRMALGSTRANLLRSALGRIGRTVLLGSLLGLAGAFASTRLLAAVVYGASAQDPWALLGTALVMGTAGFLATAAPARRALRVHPVRLLREE